MTKDEFNTRVGNIIHNSDLKDVLGELVELCYNIGIDFEDFTEYLDENLRRDLGSRLISVGVIKHPEGYIQPTLNIF